MKKKAKLLLSAATVSAVLACALSGCGAAPSGDYSGSMSDSGTSGGATSDASYSGESFLDYSDSSYVYDGITEQGFISAAETPESYLSLDRNTACYSLVRRQIENGYAISPSSVRIEEMINYFGYDFDAPTDEAVGVSAYLGSCPWNESNKLMLIGVKTEEIKIDAANGNYVFLIDVSGSMSGSDRLGLAKTAFNLLAESLGEGDVLSIVTYANEVKTVLDGAECTEENKQTINSAINSLSAYGGTYGSGGLETAYSVAQNHFIEGGNNRVILISDGDFNVGVSNADEMTEFIQTKAESGVYLSVLGVGMGNTRDDMLETLALSGNGNYAYLDNETEARKVLLEELDGTLVTVAKDAKAKVAFSENVSSYRLIGYDNKLLSEDEYYNDDADAGDIGSNLCVAALYEITLAEEASGDLAEIEVSYKAVNGGEDTATSTSAGTTVTTETPSGDDLAYVSCVAEFGLILRQSEYKGNASIANVLQRLDGLTDYISHDLYKQEFVTLVGTASESGKYD